MKNLFQLIKRDLGNLIDKIVWWSLVKGSLRFFPTKVTFPAKFVDHDEIKIVILSDYPVTKTDLDKINNILKPKVKAKKTVKKPTTKKTNG
jgi:hypothetical protein